MMTKNNGRRLVCGLLLASASIFCVAKPDSTGSGTQSVVANQGGVEVTLADIDAFAAQIPEKDRAHFFDNPQRIQSVIVNLLLRKQLAAEAIAAGLSNDPAVVKANENAKEAALSIADMNHVKADLKMPDLSELAWEEYVAHKEAYRTSADLSVKHILISTTSRSEADAKALATQIEADARKDPSRFDALVEKYSDDPEKGSTHGLITDPRSKQYSPEFTAAAVALDNLDEISPVVKTSVGFEVLKLTAKAPEKANSFEEARAGIIAKLKQNYIEKSLKEHVDILRNKRLDANPDLVSSLRTRYAQNPLQPKSESGSTTTR